MALLAQHRKLALVGALVASLTIAGAAAAGSPPRSTHASSTAVTHAANSSSEDESADEVGHELGSAVATAAQSTFTGGPHDNHGGYVSCIARGGSNCTSSRPTLPAHGQSSHAGDHKP